MRNVLYIVAALVFLLSCSGSKEAVQKQEAKKQDKMEVPQWVNERPSSSIYYVGIGYASKKTSPVDFRDIAKKNALNDLASGISVNVSTNSVLSQLETNNLYREEFKQDINVSVNEQLQNYEEVATYENVEGIWVYYQLSKSEYQEAKQKEVDAAVYQGLDYLKKAIDFKSQGRYKDCLLSYVSGMEKIKRHLDQSLETQLDGRTISLGNELFNGYRTVLNEIVIDAQEEVYRAKIGAVGSMPFVVKSIDGKKLPAISLQIEIKKDLYSYAQGLSDANGMYTVNVGKVSRQTSAQYIQVSIDVKQILREAAVSSLISKLFMLVTPLSEKISIEALPVFVMIQSEEKNNGTLLSQRWLDGAFREALVSNGFIPVNVADKADLVVEIHAEASDAGSNSDNGMQFFASLLNVEVSLKHKSSGQLIYQNNLTPIKGTQLSFQKAAEDAYIKAVKKIKLNVASDLMKAYLQ
ncbi:MAG: LPP20 family lipoprotein [Flavobacteriales bacterium]